MLSHGFYFTACVDILQILGKINFGVVFMFDRALRNFNKIVFFVVIEPPYLIITGNTLQVDRFIGKIYVFYCHFRVGIIMVMVMGLLLVLLADMDSYFWDLNTDHNGGTHGCLVVVTAFGLRQWA